MWEAKAGVPWWGQGYFVWLCECRVRKVRIKIWHLLTFNISNTLKQFPPSKATVIHFGISSGPLQKSIRCICYPICNLKLDVKTNLVWKWLIILRIYTPEKKCCIRRGYTTTGIPDGVFLRDVQGETDIPFWG